MIRFWLPTPPSVNTLYGRGKGGAVYRTKKYEKWIEYANECGLEQSAGKLGKISGNYQFKMLMPDIRGDLDNTIKAASDICVKWELVEDDRYMKRVVVEEDAALPAGRCWVELETL